jgi:hypothetical protein
VADQPVAPPKRYQVPTHLQVADKIALGPFSVTIRQGAILLLGVALAYQGWHLLALLSDLGLGWLRVILTCLILLLAVVLAQVRLSGRHLELWILVWLRFRWQHRAFVWCRRSRRLLDTPTVQKGTL